MKTLVGSLFEVVFLQVNVKMLVFPDSYISICVFEARQNGTAFTPKKYIQQTKKDLK